MRKLTLLLFMLSMSIGSLMAQKDIYKFRYDISCRGRGQGGTKQIEITTWCGKKGDLEESAKRDCLHGLIFSGIKLGNGECPKFPIIPNSSESDPKHKEFFDHFFYTPSEYNRFINGCFLQEPMGVQKVKEGGHKGTYKMNVEYDALVDYLEQKGIVKKLSNRL
jgi:hypothetical protein